MDDRAPPALAALDVPVQIRSVVGPEAASLPTAVGIVNPPVQPAGEEAERIRDPQHHPFFGLRQQGEQRIGPGAGGDRHVGPQPERVELIHPVVVVVVGAAGIGHALHLRSRRGIQGPTLRAVLAGRLRAVQDAALAAVEAGHVAAAGERGPDDPVPVYVDAARRVPGLRRIDIGILDGRRFVDLGDARLRRVVAPVEAHEPAGERSGPRDPGRVVHRVGDDPVGEPGQTGVARRVDFLARLVPRRRNAPVGVGVDHRRAPALRRLLVARLVVHPRVEPADHVRVAAEPQRVALVLRELQVMRPVAAVDERERLGGRVVDRYLASAARDREVACGRMVGALPAPVRVGAPADRGGQPDPSPRVHHRVVRVGRRVEDDLVAPVRRRLEAGRGREHRGHHLGRLAERDGDLHRFVPRRVGDHQGVVGDGYAVDEAVGVDRRLPLVGGDLVVDVGGLPRPLPHGQHQVALDALRPRRGVGHLAGGDTVAPVGEHRQAAVAAEAVEDAAHLRAALPEGDPVVPCLDRGVEPVEMADVEREPVSHLVAELAALLGDVDPGGLTAERRRDAVAVGSGAGELVGRRGLEQRVPVVGRIDGGGLLRRHGRRCLQRHGLPRPGRHRRGIDQPVAADPHAIRGVRQVRNEKPPVVAGDDDLSEQSVEVFGLGDDPDARFGPIGTADDAPQMCCLFPTRTWLLRQYE